MKALARKATSVSALASQLQGQVRFSVTASTASSRTSKLSGAGQRCASLLCSAGNERESRTQLLKSRAASAALDYAAGLGARALE